MARKRHAKNKALPDNLYRSGSYYVYRHPQTGKRTSMGKELVPAVKAAKELNIRLSPGDPDLVQSVLAGAGGKVTAVVRRYIEERAPKRRWGEQTRKNNIAYLKRYAQIWKAREIDRLTVRDIAEELDRLTPYAYVKHRAILVDLFAFAISKGLCEHNAAAMTLKGDTGGVEKMRERLSLAQFHEVRENAPGWLRVAMDVGLITLQRRSDIVLMRYEDLREGVLYVVQQKTGARIAIKVGSGLDEVVKASRADGIACPYIVHRRPARRIAFKGQTHWAQVSRGVLTDAWKEACEGTSLERIPTGRRPTFHEIRALGGWLYEQQGRTSEQIQALMGHTTQKMTEHYLEGHTEEENWAAAEAGLTLDKPEGVGKTAR